MVFLKLFHIKKGILDVLKFPERTTFLVPYKNQSLLIKFLMAKNFQFFFNTVKIRIENDFPMAYGYKKGPFFRFTNDSRKVYL